MITSKTYGYASAVTRFVLISAFASLIGIPIAITSFSVGSKIWAVFSGIKKYKPIIKKKKKKYDKIIFF